MCSRVLQCVAACCSVLTMVTMLDSSVFRSSKKGWNKWYVIEEWMVCYWMNGVLLSIAACCSVLQCVVLCWQWMHSSIRQSASPSKRAGMCGVLQSVTECCSVLQRVALCGCVLRMVMMFDWSAFRSLKEACYIRVCSSVLQSVGVSWRRSRYSIRPSSSPRKRPGFFCGEHPLRSVLQRTTAHCNTLQHIAALYTPLQRPATYCKALKHISTPGQRPDSRSGTSTKPSSKPSGWKACRRWRPLNESNHT